MFHAATFITSDSEVSYLAIPANPIAALRVGAVGRRQRAVDADERLLDQLRAGRCGGDRLGLDRAGLRSGGRGTGWQGERGRRHDERDQ